MLKLVALKGMRKNVGSFCLFFISIIILLRDKISSYLFYSKRLRNNFLSQEDNLTYLKDKTKNSATNFKQIRLQLL